MVTCKVDTTKYSHDVWENDWYECPNCGYDSIDISFNYCPYCGETLSFDKHRDGGHGEESEK